MDNADTQPSGFSSHGALRYFQSRARYFFEPAEFARLTGRCPETTAVRLALSRLAASRRIVPVTRRPAGYLIVPTECVSRGAPPFEWWIDDCLRRIEPDYYVALLSAAGQWGSISSDRAGQHTQIMLSRPHPPLTPGLLKISFYAKTCLATTPTVAVRNATGGFRVSTRAATLLDLFRHQAEIGGVTVIGRVLRDLAPSVGGAELVSALGALNSTSTAQRFGFLCDQLAESRLASGVFEWMVRREREIGIKPLELGGVCGMPQTLVERRWKIAFNAASVARLSALQERCRARCEE